MIYKFALMDCAPLEMMTGEENQGKIGFVKTASGRVIIDPNSEKAKIVEAEIKKHPNALFFRSKAIEANVPNSNGDYFSVEELMKSYKTFEGVPFFTNHDNQNIENARGKIIYAEWVPEEKAVYTISFVDRDAFPHICRSIEEEYVRGVSMGSLWSKANISMADGTQKKIKDIVEGEEVISSYGNVCKVLKTYSGNLEKPMYKLLLEHYSSDLLFSDDHPVLIYKDGFSFVETRDIKKDDMVCIPLIYNGIFENRDRITLVNNDPSNVIVKDNGQLFLVVKVQGKEEVPFDENSYDITVENDECYIADGIAVHNCSVEYSICNICGNRAEKTEDYCFIPGTPILMDDYSVKNIEEIEVGDVVIDAFGNETKVTRFFEHDIDENIQSIKSKKICGELNCTSNHPFLVERRDKFTYIPAEFLDDKETLFTPIPKTPVSDGFFGIYTGYSEEEKLKICKFIGYYIAEGCLLHNSRKEDIGVEISLHSDEVDFKNEIIEISRAIFRKEPEVIDRNNYNHKCVNLRIYSPLLVSMIYDSCNGLARNKILSKNIICLAEPYIKHILAGYIDGDGYSDEYGRLILTTASRNLAYQLVFLLARIKITASIGSYEQNKGPNDRDGKTIIHRVGIAMLQSLNLKDCGIKCSKSYNKAILKESAQTKLKNAFDHDGFIKSSAFDIEEIKYCGKVYNIETESHGYVANNIAVHNCTHIKNRKGRKFSGKARNVVTGETKEFKDQLVYEFNYGIKFIELSAVVDPACPSCLIQGIIPNTDYLQKVANLENSFRMVKEAALEKNASKEEIEQIEGVLGTLEEFAVNLIKKRKQVEPTFAGELVEIMTKLQEWLDELVGAGYGNIKGDVPGSENPENPEGQQGQEGQAPAPAPEAQAPQLPPSTDTGVVGAVPAAASTPAPTPAPMQNNTVGKITGSPNKPTLPTKPLMPRRSYDALDGRTIQRISDQRVENGKEIMLKAASLCEKFNKTGDIDMGKRRTITEKNVQREATKEVLSNSWKEKQDFFEYIKGVPSLQDNENKLSVKKSDDSFIIVAERKDDGDSGESEKMTWAYEDLTDEQRELIKNSPKKAAAMMLDTFSKVLETNQKEGVKNMTDMNMSKNAGATSVNKNPDVITERQLDEKGLFHSRTGVEADVITQKQLDAVRKNDEKDVVTQKQLDAVRTGTEADVVTQKQLDALRTNKESDVVTQKQLEDNGNRVNNEQDVITEKQLNNISAPWARAAKTNAIYKSAAEHLKATIEVMANSVISSGCTPDEVCQVSANLVETTKNRCDLIASISEDNKSSEEIDYAKRASFWNNQKIKVASAGKQEIAQLIVDGLRKVASDSTINQDVLVSAVDVIGEGGEAVNSIANRVSEKIKESEKVAKSAASIKSELRAALSGKNEAKIKRDEERKAIIATEEAKIQRQAERDAMADIINKQALGSADTVIKTTFEESGLNKSDVNFKKNLVAFTKGALASQNLKMAAVTNVTISGDTIQIAVQTNEGEENVEIPVGENEAPAGEEQVPEGDLTGEGLENTLPESPEAAPAAAPAPAPAPAPAMASNKKTIKVAQSPMGGGVPGTPGGVSAPGASEQGLPGAAPQGGDAVQALTGEGEEEGTKEDVPTIGEQQMPWTICPECGSSDVDVTNDQGDIKGKCNNPECGAEYEAMVKKEIEFKIIKPSKAMSGEGTAETPEAPEAAPEVPALPVAAQTRLDKGTIMRVAKNKDKHGHVCPACGKTACKATKEEGGSVEYTCPACKTDIKKDVLVSVSNPDVSFLRISWDVKPNIKKCAGCNDKVIKFASELKVTKMLKNAAEKAGDFPMANCVERIARVHGGNTIGSFGPCKGKVLAECVCKQLQKLGFTKVRQMNKLAEVSLQKDPMDECLEDQSKKGHGIKEATSICNCLKKKFANEMSDNIYAQAFIEDVMEGKDGLTAQDLIAINNLTKEVKVANVEVDEEIGSDLPELKEASVEVELIKEAKGFWCDECKKPKKNCVCDKKPDGDGDKAEKKEEKKEKEACAATVTKETKVATTEKAEKKCECGKDDCKECSEEKKQAMAMNGQRIRKSNEEVFQMGNTKTAAAPKFVEHIEQNVEAGVPRAKAYMGKEKEADSMINKEPGKPNVPRSEAYMGKERDADSMINAPLKGPDVAQDSSYMGHEKEVQKNMPAINLDIKGTVIAGNEKNVKEAKQLKEIETVEKNVDAKVPRSDGKIGEESKADSLINSPNKGPDVPRSKAYMGEEGNADSLINKDMKGPDVPVDSAYMGHEKEVQKDMPGINDEYLKLVRQQRNDQLNKIAAAREKKATQVVSWLVANRRIPSDMETFEDAVKALAGFEIDKIASVAEKLFPETKAIRTASSEAKTVEASGHSIPAVNLQSKTASDDSLTSKLGKAFTIGSQKFDALLSEEGEK